MLARDALGSVRSPSTSADLVDAVYNGAVKRVGPVVMLGTVITAGLLPIMRSHGTGTDVMKRIAAPMVGGVVTTVLVVYPAIYYIWRASGLQTVLMAGVRKLREPGKEVSVSRLGVVAADNVKPETRSRTKALFR